MVSRRSQRTVWQRIKDEVYDLWRAYSFYIPLFVVIFCYIGCIIFVFSIGPPQNGEEWMRCYFCEGKKICTREHPWNFDCAHPKWDKFLERGRFDPDLGVFGKIGYFLEDVGNKITGGGKED